MCFSLWLSKSSFFFLKFQYIQLEVNSCFWKSLLNQMTCNILGGIKNLQWMWQPAWVKTSPWCPTMADEWTWGADLYKRRRCKVPLRHHREALKTQKGGTYRCLLFLQMFLTFFLVICHGIYIYIYVPESNWCSRIASINEDTRCRQCISGIPVWDFGDGIWSFLIFQFTHF